jgi:4-amino-4-deoxy-L-arabinose transferase-like glycosyltransferase
MASKFSLRPSSLPFSIGLFLFSIYLLSFSGRVHVMDELAVFTAGYNLARNGRADINQLIWTNHWTPNPPGVWGLDGNLYTKKPPGISFITAPLIGLGGAIPGLNHVHVALLTNTLVTALTAGLLFVWLIDLGFSRPAATLTSLGYGLFTIAWVYARMFWESSLLALVFLVAMWSIYRAVYLAQAGRRWRWLLLCGIALGIGLTLRFEAALIILLIGIYLLASGPGTERHDGSANEGSPKATQGLPRPSRPASGVWPLVRSLIIFLAPSIVIGLGLLYFNFLRFGSLTETGYTQEILFRKP